MSCLSEISLVVLEKILKNVKIFLLCCYYLPSEEGQGPSFDKNWIPNTQRCPVPSLVEIGLVALKKKSSMYCHYVGIMKKLIDGHLDRQTYREIDNKLQVFHKSK